MLIPSRDSLPTHPPTHLAGNEEAALLVSLEGGEAHFRSCGRVATEGGDIVDEVSRLHALADAVNHEDKVADRDLRERGKGGGRRERKR